MEINSLSGVYTKSKQITNLFIFKCNKFLSVNGWKRIFRKPQTRYVSTRDEDVFSES